MEFDPEWASQIRLKKFQFHNQQWLETVLNDGADHDSFLEMEEEVTSGLSFGRS